MGGAFGSANVAWRRIRLCLSRSHLQQRVDHVAVVNAGCRRVGHVTGRSGGHRLPCRRERLRHSGMHTPPCANAIDMRAAFGHAHARIRECTSPCAHRIRMHICPHSRMNMPTFTTAYLHPRLPHSDVHMPTFANACAHIRECMCTHSRTHTCIRARRMTFAVDSTSARVRRSRRREASARFAPASSGIDDSSIRSRFSRSASLTGGISRYLAIRIRIYRMATHTGNAYA